MYNKSLKRKKRMDNLVDILFLAPQYILYFGLTILPFLIAIPLIFQNRLDFLDTDVEFVGLDNFVSLFQAPIVEPFLKAIKRTVVFLLLNYSTVFLYGMPLALLMYELTTKYKKTFFTVIYLPYIISGLGIGMLLMMLFSPDSGSMNLLLMKLGILDRPIDVKDPDVVVWALPAIVGWRYAGFNMALFLSGLLSIPTDTIEAAVVDGANYLRRLRYIYFPQMMSSIIMATIFCLIGSFGVFDELVGMGALMVPDLEYFAILLYHVGLGGGWGSKIGTLSQAITMSFTVYLPLIALAFGLNRWQKKLQY